MKVMLAQLIRSDSREGGRLQQRCLVGQGAAPRSRPRARRRPDLLGGQIGREGRDEGQGGVGRALVHAPAQPADEQEHDDPDGHAADHGDGEGLGHISRADRLGVGGAPSPCATANPAAQGSAQGDQRGGVIEQRLALEDRRHPAGQPDPAGHGGGCDGIRGATIAPSAMATPQWTSST